MDTNLKKSKSIRIFIYRILMVSSLVTMIASGIFGREALVNCAKEGPGTLTGDIYYLTEMREYMAELFQNYMIAHVGIADDTGYPLTDANAESYELACHSSFMNQTRYSGKSILYQYQKIHPNKENTITSQEGNIDFPLYSENDGHLLETDDFIVTVYWDGPLGQLRFFDKVYSAPVPGAEYLSQTNYSPEWEAAAKTRFVLGYKESYIKAYGVLSDMESIAKGYQQMLILFFSSMALFLIFGVLSLLSVRKFPLCAESYSRLSRKVLLEGKLLLLILVIVLWLENNLNMTAAPLERRILLYQSLWLYYPIAMVVYLLWLDIRRGGAECLKNSLAYKTFQVLKNWNASIPWKRKMQRVCPVLVCSIIANGTLILLLPGIFNGRISGGLACILVALCILFLCQCTALTRFYHFIQDTAVLLGKVDLLREGQPIHGMTLSRKSLLTASAYAIMDLESGMKKAVEQENKANRMRVELITNVSHDLKTPLTSIINYADLLSEEELNAPASEYVEALRTKAYRLKKMVQDVFELSKATTGNLPIENTKLDLAKLVKQTLADMDEELQNSALQFKLKITNEPLFILADGEKMYRVFQNLLVNAMQYSLPGSRVHILLEEQDGKAIARVKNVSREEMNFDPEEIVERFVRADSSRTKEGSGLGLSIAQSFTQACGGEFTVSIDADLFTATICFPLLKEEGTIHEQAPEEL